MKVRYTRKVYIHTYVVVNVAVSVGIGVQCVSAECVRWEAWHISHRGILLVCFSGMSFIYTPGAMCVQNFSN